MLQTLEQTFYTKVFWVTAVIIGVYVYLKLVVYNYWKRKGVPHESPLIPVGNALSIVLGKISLGNLIKDSYEKFKNHRFHGIYIFHQPIMIINDPDLIRLILVKDFNKFRDRGLYHNEEVDPLSSNLFFLPGEKWKKLRAKLTPIFTSGKLKQMFPLLKEIGDDLTRVCNKMSEENDIIDLKNLTGRYTTDSIASVVFGFDCKSLENPVNEFSHHINMINNQNPIKNAVGAFAPMILDILRIPFIPRPVVAFFSTLFDDVIYERRQNSTVRMDFINLLLQLMDKGHLGDDNTTAISNGFGTESDDEKLTLWQAKAQAFVFFAAGYETTSSTITYCLYELALNPDIQEKVHEEIDGVANKAAGLTYESVANDYEFLNMVFSETLRKHPSLPFLNRLCIEDFQIPDGNFTVKKGTKVIISVSGLHRDPNIYPDPDKFDPYRWTKENTAARSPYVYLPFGTGNRNCIGARFGIMQSKIALISVLTHFKFSICEKTPIPVNYSKGALVQTPVGGVYLKMERRKN